MKKLIVFLLLISQVSYAQESNTVKLEQGQPAPFSGFLITRDKVEKLYNLDLDIKFHMKKVDILEQQNVLLSQQLERDNKYIENLSKQVVDMKDSNIWNRVGFFVLGATITTLLAFGVSRATR